ncbi:MAG: hypothetical protein R2741_12200 [Methanolobus sp.]
MGKLAEQGFEAVEKEILECKDCQLHETVTNKVISKGSRTPEGCFC